MDCFKLQPALSPTSPFLSLICHEVCSRSQAISELTFQQRTAALRCHCCSIPQFPVAVFVDMATNRKPGAAKVSPDLQLSLPPTIIHAGAELIMISSTLAELDVLLRAVFIKDFTAASCTDLSLIIWPLNGENNFKIQATTKSSRVVVQLCRSLQDHKSMEGIINMLHLIRSCPGHVVVPAVKENRLLITRNEFRNGSD